MSHNPKNRTSKTGKLFIKFVELQPTEDLPTELSQDELNNISGGARCPEITTLACGEEPRGCSGC